MDAIENLSSEQFTGVVWRTAWRQRDPLIGSTGGGRWDPLGGFEVLYASTEQNGSIAEVYYHLSQAPVFSSSDVLLHKLNISLERVVSLDETALVQLGLEEPLASRCDYSKSQAISGAARFLEFQGMLVPSARWSCSNLVIFMDQIDINTAISIGSNELINWPAWKEQIKNAK